MPIDFTCVQYTVCLHTQNDIWTPETEISGHYVSVLPLCTAGVSDAMTLLHAQPTHSTELPRSVGRDVNDVTSGGRYG
jgi:hypothetical protein